MLRARTTSLSKPSMKAQKPSSSLFHSNISGNHSIFVNSKTSFSKSIIKSNRCYSSSSESSNIIEGTDDNIQQLALSSKTPTIVDFYADWCGPCKVLGPMLERYINETNGKVQMVKVNVDENMGAAEHFHINALPTIHAYHNGKPVEQWVGLKPETDIKELVEKMASLADETKE